ncbi:formylglycine-generating enzyme family protein [Planomonospora venezuelensis]|uniref:Formylglycine-generating enzyme required for sulfatase activity n=1 Tax=Planomonospora venezuelensis TaxID=1999 RepID=A0A841CVU6_PLAVE|nr:formylglycine-generating enzyme family protein [Planomonospora venezuelensis]MBB5962512.1 formylglycine-generating enzyme required for sulfatase activity [Planomonospora venezuelensis]
MEPVRFAAAGRHAAEQAELPGGAFLMGDSRGDGNPGDGETPVHRVVVRPFSIDATCVTTADFAAFAEATGYRTEAELYGFSAVFHLALSARPQDVMRPVPGAPWWVGVRGADWRHPGGVLSEAEPDHPVVHVSWNDATAYCSWAGRRLPTEAEWEYASRGGLEGARYPWGDELPRDEWRVNIWQGDFPSRNTLEDGHLTTAPVRAFAPNAYGLRQTVGNVWEWCADWYAPDYYARSPEEDPRGPRRGTARVLRGGSFLCHDSYCNRYRNSARSANTPGSSMANAGFRTARDRAPSPEPGSRIR